MASVFTYEPETPKVASPWLQEQGLRSPQEDCQVETSESLQSVPVVTQLQAEPQDGPVEYKLHLLLRPRRKFQTISTGHRLSGSKHSKLGSDRSTRTPPKATIDLTETEAPSASSTHQTRQHRLEQLTTQLLWRLQQSSPHHSSSASNIILPSLPEALPELKAPQLPEKLLHGLEESQGALYEIGVSDDGQLVGLAEDEMRESLDNLRAMAACLGCTVEVLREEVVGHCEWLDDALHASSLMRKSRSGDLLVVEALVKPFLQSKCRENRTGDVPERGSHQDRRATEELRVTLTGPTGSGKSTLLGTLATSSFDNGRGTSRLGMLKHRHEITSGLTSSVSQELLGYRDIADGSAEVLNYATANLASWIDIHDSANGGRLILITDSAGHPRYRRTTVRGLVGWAPHWTLMCLPANDKEDALSAAESSISHDTLSPTYSRIDLTSAQLGLCLRLQIPLVVVITKLDVASRGGLKSTLTRVLDDLKAAGRKPMMIGNPPTTAAKHLLQVVDSLVIDAAYNASLPLLHDPVRTVPIVLTSTVDGTGVANLHGLLHELPIPQRRDNPIQIMGLGFVLHIEDVYSKPADEKGVVVSGILRHGRVTVGDSGVVGPFSTHDMQDSLGTTHQSLSRQSVCLPTSRSFPGALRGPHEAAHYPLPDQEWKRFKVTSIRNLRLPVHTLLEDQVGTIAIVPYDQSFGNGQCSSFGQTRKGMILAAMQPPASRSFVAQFRREDLESLAVGNHVVVYIASVRAPARVMSAHTPDPLPTADDQLDPFTFEDRHGSGVKGDEERNPAAGRATDFQLLVTFRFETSKEFVVVGDQVLVMPGGGPGLYGGSERGKKGLAGLDGFVGRITGVVG